MVNVLHRKPAISLKWGKSGPRLLLMTTRKLRTHFRFVLKSLTLDDPERPFRTLFQNTYVFGAHHENLKEDRPILLEAKMWRNDLVSGNITFIRISAGVPLRRGVKRQSGNRKRRFSGPSDATSSVSYEMRSTLLYSII